MRIIDRITLSVALAAFLPCQLTAQIDTSSTLVVVAGQEAALAYNQGLTDFGEGRYTKALMDFSDAVDANPSFDKALYNRGVMELHERINQAAVEDFDNAITINPNKAHYHLGRAIALARLSHYDEALKSIRTAEKLGYSATAIRYYYGYIYFRMGKLSEARSSYDEAIKANSRFAQAYCDRATVHVRTGNYKAALDDYNTALEIMPNAYYVYTLRADAKANMGNFSAAIQDISYAIQASEAEDDFQFLNARGRMYGRWGKCQKAMADFNECIRLQPKNPDTYINIGLMLMDQKNYAEAEEQFTTAIKYDGYNISAYHNRANARELQMKLSLAEKDRKMANYLNDERKKYIIN